MAKASAYCIIETAAKDRAEAEKIAREILKQKLAACANILPSIRSIYWWKGKLEHNSEALLLFKTRKEKVKELVKKVKEMHSYTTPAILVFEIKEADEDYLKWVDKEIKDRK